MSDPRTLHCHSVAGADLTWGRVAAGPLSRDQPGRKRRSLLIKVLRYLVQVNEELTLSVGDV